MNEPTATDTTAPAMPSAFPFLLGAFVACVGALLAYGQALYVTATGSELCVGEGCALVGDLTRISPALFNLLGGGVFTLIALLAFGLRKRAPGFLRSAQTALLRAILVGAIGAEGVLVAYQWFVAGAWCSYCLVILGLVALLNLLLLGRYVLAGAAAFAGAAAIFSLLSFVPFNKTIDDGTFAIRPGTGGGPEVILLFSENCPHCLEVEHALSELTRCTARYNPVVRLTEELLPDIPRTEGYDPRVNEAAAALLGFTKVPILLVREEEGLRAIGGQGAILSHLREVCGEEEAPPQQAFDLGLSPFSSPGAVEVEEEGCGIRTEDCD